MKSEIFFITFLNLFGMYKLRSKFFPKSGTITRFSFLKVIEQEKEQNLNKKLQEPVVKIFQSQLNLFQFDFYYTNFSKCLEQLTKFEVHEFLEILQENRTEYYTRSFLGRRVQLFGRKNGTSTFTIFIRSFVVLVRSLLNISMRSTLNFSK